MRHPLLHRLIDYAGLFPPAGLDMDTAVREYRTHLDEQESWMLGRFICPESRLVELQSYRSLFGATHTLRVSVLPAGGVSLRDRVERASTASDDFERAMDGSASVEVFEARVPDRLSAARLAASAEAATGRWLYVEWQADRADLPECLEELQAARAEGSSRLGAKIRCGGTEPEAYPTERQVARFLHVCATLDLPFKATAGLHHPVRHDRDGVTMHGFLNVFVAHLMARELKLDLAAVEAIVAERDPTAFSLREGSVGWRDLSVPAAQVENALRHGNAYGSCSFVEPVEDLQAASWFTAP